jgi:galactofuranosylgalactofuranosylrhamnosyl-N-acetylglucosaminyl-diphospho-decaprenol beta-1,5/1,6-galactofuranosyltransferase
MYDRSTLHTWGEAVNQYRFFWGAVPGFKEGHNFAQQNLRSTPWLHKRCDVDYNGWWMCLIPTDVVREIGLALPVFIKWDDSEFGLRARRAGVRTVTLPGAAVWHVPWTDKDDTIDWQAYFHQRNRWLVALLYSPYRRGGNLPKESFMVDVKHLLSQQYSAVELRLQALEDLLDGPHRLHADLDTKLAHIRAVRSEFTDSRVLADPGVFPESWLPKPPRRGKRPTRPRTLVQGVTAAASSALRSLRPVRPTATAQPEAEIAAMDARWWMVSRFDSALVTTADGTGASWYQRQPETFRRLLARSLRLHERLLREWDVLTGEYRRSHSELVSFEQWEKTFGIGSQQE